jgi:competence protein ComEC
MDLRRLAAKSMRTFGAPLTLAFVLLLAGAGLVAQNNVRGRSMFGGADARLVVWVFDIGQGDSIFIESPTGKQFLIDGGPDRAVLRKLSDVLPFWDRTLDAVLLTHPHADHVAGLVETLAQYDVAQAYTTGATSNTAVQHAFEADLSDGAPQTVTADHRMSVDLGGGATLDILYPSAPVDHTPDDPNLTSIVALLTYGDTTMLLMGDMPVAHEMEIADAIDGPVDILKVGHHGSGGSTSEDFLADVAPRYGVISVGAVNDYGHPHPNTLERLARHRVQLFRTDLDGDIRITSDGGEPVVEAMPLPF